jgi:hypothetical protein
MPAFRKKRPSVAPALMIDGYAGPELGRGRPAVAWGGPARRQPFLNQAIIRSDSVRDANSCGTGVARTARRPRPRLGTVEKLKRLSINMRRDLHHRFKIACARAILAMAAKVLSKVATALRYGEGS